jgi:hypothetical protein
MTDALAAKSGSRGEIHDWYCQGLTGCSARIRSTDDTESWRPSPALVISASSSGPVQRDSGTPVAAGSWQASAMTAARVSSLIRRGRPERGRSASPSRPRPANRPHAPALASRGPPNTGRPQPAALPGRHGCLVKGLALQR